MDSWSSVNKYRILGMGKKRQIWNYFFLLWTTIKCGLSEAKVKSVNYVFVVNYTEDGQEDLGLFLDSIYFNLDL
jgi:hypothetical protein